MGGLGGSVYAVWTVVLGGVVRFVFWVFGLVFRQWGEVFWALVFEDVEVFWLVGGFWWFITVDTWPFGIAFGDRS